MSTETKELLTLAAKAMGLTPVDKGPFVFTVQGDGYMRPWNPLTSADDLVEMECEKSVEIIWAASRCNAVSLQGVETFSANEHYHNHPSRRAARAMASLRVVAEIGRRME